LYTGVVLAIVDFDIQKRYSFANGTSFGNTGSYEQIDAVAHYAVDPASLANHEIVDLASTKRGADGLVHYEGDVTLLRPVDPNRSRRAALVEVPNRGYRTAGRLFNRAPTLVEPTPEIDPGDGFLFRHGWTMAWCGWQWDVPRSDGRMGLTAPLVVDDMGEEIDAEVQLRLQIHERMMSVDLTDHHVGLLGGHQPLPTRDLNDASARLLRRDEIWGEPEEMPRSSWSFARSDGSGQPVLDPNHVWLSTGFEPGRIYDLVYRTPHCPVVGVGLLAVRDLGAFLRSEKVSNPCSGELDHLIATGQSQCGRFLRTSLHLGLNRDEDGNAVYDGLLVHIAGGRRGEFNHRVGQPSVQPTPSFGHRPPFADDPQLDPHSGSSEGLLDRQLELGHVPKVFFTDTSSEYWRGDASLTHTSMLDGSDIELPATTRRYLFSSTQHSPGMLPLTSHSIFGSQGANYFNTVDYTPLMRAAITNLLAWIADDVEPPPNAIPRTSDGSAMSREAVLDSLEAIEGLARPVPSVLSTIRPLDLGPGEPDGIGTYPAQPVGAAYPCLVSAVDESGNEIAGIRLPEVAVPVATNTGWNPRHPTTGGLGQILDYVGSTLPLARDRDTRTVASDPRLSIAERYIDEDDYRFRLRQQAELLLADRYLLAEDIATCESIALQRYRAFVESK